MDSTEKPKKENSSEDKLKAVKEEHVELILGTRKREWKDKSGNVLTTVLYDEKEFNLRDCILSWYLLSFYTINENEPFKRSFIKMSEDGSLKLGFTQKSTMPFEIVEDLLSTPIGGDKGIPISYYDGEHDWEDTKYAHTYYDIFNFFSTGRKVIFVDNPVPWNPIEIWKCDTADNFEEGVPVHRESSRDIGLRWHSINTVFFDFNENEIPTFTKCLTYGYGR